MDYVLAGLIGMMSGVALANVWSLGKIALLVEQTGLQALKMIISVAEDIEFLRAVKYKMVEEVGETAAAIRQRNVDDYEFEKWKKGMIDRYLSSYPSIFRQNLNFHDWDGAVVYLSQNTRKL